MFIGSGTGINISCNFKECYTSKFIPFNTTSDSQCVTIKVRLNHPAFRKHNIVVLCQS